MSSMSVTSSPPIITISGRAEVTRVSSGMVATGFSLALIPWKISIESCIAIEMLLDGRY